MKEKKKRNPTMSKLVSTIALLRRALTIHDKLVRKVALLVTLLIPVKFLLLYPGEEDTGA